MSASHVRRRCPDKKGCTEKDCAQPLTHHLLLHIPTDTQPEHSGSERNAGQNVTPEMELPVNSSTMADTKRTLVLLKVVPVSIAAKNGIVVSTYGLLDTGAVNSLITSKRAERLQLQGTPERVSITTVTHDSHNCELSKVKFVVHPVNGDVPCFPVSHALVVDSLNMSSRYCPNQLDLLEWPHLEGVELPNPSVDMSELSVLIGQDVTQAHMVLNYRWGDDPQTEPYAMKTPFGWCVAGPTNERADNNKPVALSVFQFNWAEDKPEFELLQQIEAFWASEKHRFQCGDESSVSIEDKRALEMLNASIELKNGRYEVGLLWKNQNVQLPNNRSLAKESS